MTARWPTTVVVALAASLLLAACSDGDIGASSTPMMAATVRASGPSALTGQR